MIQLPYSIDLKKNHQDGLSQLKELCQTSTLLVGIGDTCLYGTLPVKEDDIASLSKAITALNLDTLETLSRTKPESLFFTPDSVSINNIRYTIRVLTHTLRLTKPEQPEQVIKELSSVYDRGQRVLLVDKTQDSKICFPYFKTIYQETPIKFGETEADYYGHTLGYIAVSDDSIKLKETPNLFYPNRCNQRETLSIIGNTLSLLGYTPILQPVLPLKPNPIYLPLNADFFLNYATDFYISNPWVFASGTTHTISYYTIHPLTEVTHLTTLTELKESFKGLNQLAPNATPVLIGEVLLYHIPDKIDSTSQEGIIVDGKPYQFGLLFQPLDTTLIQSMFDEYTQMITNSGIPTMSRESVETAYNTTLHMISGNHKKLPQEEWVASVYRCIAMLQSQDFQEHLKPAEITRLSYEADKFYKKYPKA